MSTPHVALLQETRRLVARGVLFAAALSLACNLGAMSVPLFNMELFNRVLPTRNPATLVAMLGALGIALATYAAIDHFRSAALAALADRAAGRLLPRLLEIAAAMPAREDRGAPLRDLERLRLFVASPVSVAPFDLLWAPVLIGVLLVQHWGYALTAILSCLTLLLLNLLGDMASRKHLLRASHDAALGLRDVAAAVRGAEAVLAMGMLPALSARWDAAQRPTLAAARRAMLRSRAITSLTRTLRMAMTGVMVALGLVLVLAGLASSGSMVAGNMILAKILMPFEQIANTYRQWVEALAAWQRLRAVLETQLPQRYTAPLPAPRGELLVDRVVHAPAGADRAVLRGVSFHLAPGEVLGIIGPSGAGKSTLLRLILGMESPTAGGVFVDGHQTFLWEREDLARHIGYVPQALALVGETVADNIARMQVPDLSRVRHAALRAGIHGAIAALPHGYATRLAGFTLSSGQRQRIALARALYEEPKLLVLDEPSAFLDQDGEAALAALLARLKHDGIGMIVVTHRPALIGMADSLLVLREGQVEEYGAREKVLAALRTPVVRLVPADAARGIAG